VLTLLLARPLLLPFRLPQLERVTYLVLDEADRMVYEGCVATLFCCRCRPSRRRRRRRRRR